AAGDDPEAVPRIGPFERRQVIRRSLMLAVTAFFLYLLAPGLFELFSSWPQLRELGFGWLLLMFALEVGSFASLWLLQKLALQAKRWLPIITSQLAGNAFGRVVPGGGAAAGAFQYRMLRDAGIPPGSIATGLTAVHLLTFGTLVALPVLAVPAVLNGADVADGLVRGLWIALGALLILFVLGAVFLSTERPLRAMGRLIEATRNRLLPRREPLAGLPDTLVGERDLIRSVLGSRWWEALLASIGRWLFDFGVLLVVLLALGVDAGPALVLLAYVTASLLGMIPITPGGLGFVEAGLTATLALAGVNAGDAIVATLAYRLVSFWLPLPFGAIAIPLHRRLVADEDPDSDGDSRVR
ncbi:MAG: YbhN family protein, partial [Acidobacteriota bacterium]